MNQRILVLSAHPDDAETCVAGTICCLSGAGHAVHIVHLTCSAPVRATEARTAATILGASVELWDYPDGALRVTDESLGRLRDKMRELAPHLILAHWPVDFHQDHQAVGSLVMQALHSLEGQLHPWPELHFYEACLGYQTYHFHPNHYVDITAHLERKRAAVAAHASVNCLENYPIHETMQKARGYESGFSYAEAFIRLPFRLGGVRHSIVGEANELARSD